MYHREPRRSRDSRGDSRTIGNEISKAFDLHTVSSVQHKATPGALEPSMTSERSPFLRWMPQPSPLGQAGTPWPPSVPVQKLVMNEPGAFSNERKRQRNEQLFTEEMEKKRVRRERNRIAAARCRNRRQKLTECLQDETDQLEKDKSKLQEAIAELEKLKDQLELILEAHQPVCKMRHAAPEAAEARKPVSVGSIKAEPVSSGLSDCMSSTSVSRPEKPKPNVCPLALPAACTSSPGLLLTPKVESLYTPLFFFSPSPTPLSLSMVFTYPTSPLDCKPPASSQQSQPASSSSAALGMSSQTCGVAHRRASSSGDQWSDHSLNSPTLLGL
ncbi:fos-related antigen 1-like [Brienomyrus brachyistius]|uniref:fos-related antigen 1-like n=1 Tax=Brienomyrus brachyistius TaxID=42636 RepID=UPI0020B20E6A|nr:fos-related antigen 1-like [Brienomyrus brachyistius]